MLKQPLTGGVPEFLQAPLCLIYLHQRQCDTLLNLKLIGPKMAEV